MQKPRLIFIQVLGIILLMCGYFISDQPDSESVMHFNLSAAHSLSAVKHNNGVATSLVSISTDDRTSHKSRGYKHFSFKVILPLGYSVGHSAIPSGEGYQYPLTENYHYLFCREINPPPPKAC